MGVVETIKRALVWVGVMPMFSEGDIKDAETYNLTVDRERTISQLSEAAEQFKSKTQEVLANVDKGKSELLSHIEHIGSSVSSSAGRRPRYRFYRYRGPSV